MFEPILSKEYWKNRLLQVQEHNAPLHHAIFKCPVDRWKCIASKHKEILGQHVYSDTVILDAGCGWGRLLDLLPLWWGGRYLGVDLSPDFLNIAESRYPTKRFQCLDLRNLSYIHGAFDLAVLVSIRPMIRRNCGDNVWEEIEKNLYSVCTKCLYLEYDETDPGSIEVEITKQTEVPFHTPEDKPEDMK